jgi:hypothetical protein
MNQRLDEHPYLHLVPEAKDSDNPLPPFDQPIDLNREEETPKIVSTSRFSDISERIQVVRTNLQILERMLATIDQKTDKELYEDLKKFDGCCLDGNHTGDRYPNSPHPMVKKRKSDGRLVYHDPENSKHHEQLLMVRLIDLATDKREHYREWLKKTEGGQ